MCNGTVAHYQPEILYASLKRTASVSLGCAVSENYICLAHQLRMGTGHEACHPSVNALVEKDRYFFGACAQLL